MAFNDTTWPGLTDEEKAKYASADDASPSSFISAGWPRLSPEDMAQYVPGGPTGPSIDHQTDNIPVAQPIDQQAVNDAAQQQIAGLQTPTVKSHEGLLSRINSKPGLSDALINWGAAMMTPGVSFGQAFGAANQAFSGTLAEERERRRREAALLEKQRRDDTKLSADGLWTQTYDPTTGQWTQTPNSAPMAYRDLMHDRDRRESIEDMYTKADLDLQRDLAKPDYRVITTKDADGNETSQIVRVGGDGAIVPMGGAPAAGADGAPSVAPATGGQRTMGWTPRGNKHGNPNASVDNKMKLISQGLGGVDVDAPLTEAQFLAQDMTALEGKAAGRHNYGNMKNTDGSWKQFNSRAEYDQAQRAWLGRRWKEGARTIRDAVEGRLVGGSGGNAVTGRGPALVNSGNGVQVLATFGGGQGSSSLGDETLTGDAYLATLPKDMQQTVKAISEGRMPMPSGMALGKPYWQKVVTALGYYDPQFDAADAKTRAATRKDFAGGGKSANAVTALNTAIGHIAGLARDAANLDNGNWQTGNIIKNAVKKEFGSDIVSAYEENRQAVADEFTRVFRQTGGTQAEVDSWLEHFSSASSPKQFAAVFKKAAELLKSRLDALADQYTQGMGRSRDAYSFLNAHTTGQFDALSNGLVPQAFDEKGKLVGKAAPKVGTVQDGYRFRGGDPAFKSNWTKVN